MSATYEQTSFPQETQFAGVLQMGVQELRDYVETALQENPVFELSDPGEEMLEDPNFARKREWLEAGDWQDSYYQGQDEEDGSRDPLSRMGYYLSDENDLSRFVLSQFIGTKLEPEVLQAVELLCDRLDDDGFLSEDPAELAASLGVSDAVISRALTELQAADPAGVGARDRTECLSLQIERHAGDHRLARIIVEATVVAPVRFSATMMGRSRRDTLATPSPLHISSSSSCVRPTFSTPSMIAMVAGTAPSARTMRSTSAAKARLSG